MINLDKFFKQTIPEGLIGVGFIKIITTLMSVCITVLLARLLEPGKFGEYSFVLALVSLSTLPLLQGLPVLIIREVAQFKLQVTGYSIQKILRYADTVILGLCSILVGLWVVWSTLISSQPNDWILSKLILAAFGIPLIVSLTSVRSAVVRGLGMPVRGQLPEILIRPFIFLGLLITTSYTFKLTAMDAIQLHLIAAATAFLASVCIMRNTLPINVDIQNVQLSTIKLTKSLVPLSFISGMQVVNSQLDLIMLGVLADEYEVGIYKIASVLALQVSFVMTIVNVVFAPRFVEYHKKNEISELKQLNRNGAALSFTGGFLICIILLIFGPWFIRFAIGDAYLPAMLPLMILMIAHLLTLWAGSSNIVLSMIGNENDVLVSVVCSTLVNLVLNYLLIPKFGMIGAASSSAAALILWRIILRTYYINRLG